ncbi:glycosyltransferase [Pseudoclavibacter sp. CFCC 13796]|uniref:glycosyltransferase n=1 Tax=Pseudoclavibacter sp. CFCC 13796 TaxID=2615179 RepID=UPI0013010CC7|nr:glycosyltransferase [Pseudoclavibacter sp. CFCC 13796]KAB1660668.1 glycosyltransferase [Pseudoclavibacter sp. CFCC 13796]
MSAESQPQAEGTPAPRHPLDVAIVVVTYKRTKLLRVLLDSFTELKTAPSWIVIVDNASHDDTGEIVESYRERLGKRADGRDRLVYAPQEENTGGAGGFSAGTKIAYDLGAEWLWLMDDDVAVLPEAIERLTPWTDRFKVIQGRRYNYDGSPFYWQFDFNVPLGIPNPVAKDDFSAQDWLPMNTVCFEGGLFHRDVVRQVGLPDPRFFIYWDDTVYGYLTSKVTTPALVNTFILRRTREIKRLDLGTRKLNGTSDMVRFHIMRNRGYMARYFRLHGDYNRFVFGFGTLLTLAKEVIRIVTVDHSFKSGLSALFKGMRGARKIYRDRSWKPMPPLD